jgi:LPXTG-site transpeptidase (sortase) family protein
MKGIFGKRLLMGVGGLALLAAAGIGGYVLLSGGDEGEGSPPAVEATQTVDATAPPAESGPPLNEVYRMIIEKIGVDAPVAPYGLDENAVPLVPQGPDASQVVAWYDFSAKPGTGSNAVFAGHVTWNGDAVFRNLNKLAEGDTIKLRDNEGGEVVYRVKSNVLVDPNDPESVKVMYPTDKDEVTIITCGGEYFETNDPIAGGDYTGRVIIKAELVDVTEAPA